jgi:hypothetical protein
MRKPNLKKHDQFGYLLRTSKYRNNFIIMFILEHAPSDVARLCMYSAPAQTVGPNGSDGPVPAAPFTSRDSESMANPNLPPTPVKLINSVVLTCINDMLYRLPFPSSDDLERLIKATGP